MALVNKLLYSKKYYHLLTLNPTITMAAEELNKPAGAVVAAASNNTDTGVGNGDMAHLIGSMGALIDSTIVSVQGIITTVSSVTGQLIEGVTSTINSDPVQGIISSVGSATGQLIEGVTSSITVESVQGVINSVSSATGQLIDGVTSTINSEPVREIFNNVTSVPGQLIDGVTSTITSVQVQNSFQELAKLWTGLLENLNAAGNSNQIQNLFNNVSAGLGQLMNGSFMPGMPGMSGNRAKKDVTQILFTPTATPVEVIVPKEVPVAPATKSAPREIVVTPPVQENKN